MQFVRAYIKICWARSCTKSISSLFKMHRFLDLQADDDEGPHVSQRDPRTNEYDSSDSFINNDPEESEPEPEPVKKRKRKRKRKRLKKVIDSDEEDESEPTKKTVEKDTKKKRPNSKSMSSKSMSPPFPVTVPCRYLFAVEEKSVQKVLLQTIAEPRALIVLTRASPDAAYVADVPVPDTEYAILDFTARFPWPLVARADRVSLRARFS